MREKIEPLQAEHDILKSFGYRVSDEKRAQLAADYPPRLHPVVRHHPVTGEKHLFVNAVFTTRIVGLDDADEAARLLTYLTERVKQPEYQVRFRCPPNAIVFWDNTATQHYATLDYWPHERVVERVTVVGTAPPLTAPTDRRRVLAAARRKLLSRNSAKAGAFRRAWGGHA